MTPRIEEDALRYIESLPEDLREVPVNIDHPRAPKRAWTSREYVVQLFAHEGPPRLSVQRSRATEIFDPSRKDLRPMGWDELMDIKRACGFGETWAVEAFPADGDVVNVAPMRHLWLLASRPSWGWSPNQ